MVQTCQHGAGFLHRRRALDRSQPTSCEAKTDNTEVFKQAQLGNKMNHLIQLVSSPFTEAPRVFTGDGMDGTANLLRHS
jgi:hypothetical protein